MAARRRTTDRKHYPPFLLKVTHKGRVRYRFKTVEGTLKLFPIGTTEAQAIQAALIYNDKHRSKGDFSLASSSRRKGDPFDKKLKDWLPVVIDRVKSEEELSRDVLKRFINECNRLERALGEVYSKSLTLADINQFLSTEYPSDGKRTLNGKISNLKKVFSYLADESAVDFNFMANKKLKKVSKSDYKKTRQDLSAEGFEAIYKAAPLFLKVAMALSLQSTHAVREIYRVKYRIKEPKEGVCGIVWHDEPKIVDGQKTYGTLYIHREKVKKSESSLVAIPVTEAINDIVQLSKTDKLHCPYVVHRKPMQATRGIAKDCDHPYQVHHHQLSKSFSQVRDSLGLYDHLDKRERPTYHEIRRLAAKIIEQSGSSATVRMAHANERTTKIYTDSQELTWKEAEAITVNIKGEP